MATLAARITALAGAVRDKLNTMTPRLLPAGGAAGQVLAKASGADSDAGWSTLPLRLTGGVSGKPADGLRLVLGKAPRAFNVSQAASAGQAVAAATASTVATLKTVSTAGAEATVGTLTWNAAAKLATVSITAAAVPAGALVVLDFPASADATLANVGVLVAEG